MGEQKKHSIGVIFPDGRVETFTTYLSFCLQYLDEAKVYVLNNYSSRHKTPFKYRGYIIGKLTAENKSQDEDLQRKFNYHVINRIEGLNTK